jgi:hypothetical protein
MSNTFKLNLYASLITSALAAATVSHAAGFEVGLVTKTWVTNPLGAPDSAAFIFKNSTAISGAPACNNNQEWAVSLKTAAGRAIQQQVLLAVALSKQVTVSGAGDCLAWGDRETVSYFAVAY